MIFVLSFLSLFYLCIYYRLAFLAVSMSYLYYRLETFPSTARRQYSTPRATCGAEMQQLIQSLDTLSRSFAQTLQRLETKLEAS